MTFKKALTLMKKLNIKGEIISHETSGRTTMEAAKALGVPPRNILKSLLLISKKKEYLAVIITGDKRVNIRKLKQITGFKKLRLAKPSEVEDFTGFKIGGVPPFAFHGKCRIIVDREVLEREYVIGACGDEYHGVKLDPEIFKKLGYEIADITE
mgnify:CR=1 FL=1